MITHLMKGKPGSEDEKLEAAKKERVQFSFGDMVFSDSLTKKTLFLSYNDKEKNTVVTKKFTPVSNGILTMRIDIVSCVKI